MSVLRCGNGACPVCSVEDSSIFRARAHAIALERIETKRQLAWSRRSLRRMMYKYISKGWKLKHLVEGEPSLEALVEPCSKAWKRLLAIRKVRKDRLLRAMPEHELNALGLTPPPVSKKVETPATCLRCLKTEQQHDFRERFCFGDGRSETFVRYWSAVSRWTLDSKGNCVLCKKARHDHNSYDACPIG